MRSEQRERSNTCTPATEGCTERQQATRTQNYLVGADAGLPVVLALRPRRGVILAEAMMSCLSFLAAVVPLRAARGRSALQPAAMCFSRLYAVEGTAMGVRDVNGQSWARDLR